MTRIARGPRSLRDATTVLESWEEGIRVPAALRGLAVLAALHPDGQAVFDLPLGEVAALATARLAEVSRDEVEGVLECGDCGALLDVRVRLSDLVGGPSGAPTPNPGNGTRFTVRPPTSRDLAAAAGEPDPRGMLLHRCVTRADGTPVEPAALAPAELAEIDDVLESLAGPAFPLLRAACPGCGGTAAGVVDVADLLWQYVAIEARTVLRDVSRLAVAFGWREADVLALSPHRRSAYLALVTP